MTLKELEKKVEELEKRLQGSCCVHCYQQPYTTPTPGYPGTTWPTPPMLPNWTNSQAGPQCNCIKCVQGISNTPLTH